MNTRIAMASILFISTARGNSSQCENLFVRDASSYAMTEARPVLAANDEIYEFNGPRFLPGTRTGDILKSLEAIGQTALVWKDKKQLQDNFLQGVRGDRILDYLDRVPAFIADGLAGDRFNDVAKAYRDTLKKLESTQLLQALNARRTSTAGETGLGQVLSAEGLNLNLDRVQLNFIRSYDSALGTHAARVVLNWEERRDALNDVEKSLTRTNAFMQDLRAKIDLRRGDMRPLDLYLDEVEGLFLTRSHLNYLLETAGRSPFGALRAQAARVLDARKQLSTTAANLRRRGLPQEAQAPAQTTLVLDDAYLASVNAAVADFAADRELLTLAPRLEVLVRSLQTGQGASWTAAQLDQTSKVLADFAKSWKDRSFFTPFDRQLYKTLTAQLKLIRRAVNDARGDT